MLHTGGADLVEVLAQHCQQLARGVLLQGLGEAGQLAKLALPTPDKTGSERLDMQLAKPTLDKPVNERLDNYQTCSADTGKKQS